MIALSHPTGNENVRQVGQALDDASLLERFFTTINWDEAGLVHHLLPEKARSLLSRRSYPAGVGAKTKAYPALELVRLLGGPVSIDTVSRGLDETVARQLAATTRGFYGYEDCALATFRAAKARGIKCIYDLPIGYWKAAQRIFAEEAEREPEWAMTLTGMNDSSEKLRRKEEELGLADCVVVASSFTKTTLAEADSGLAIRVIPYGAPPVVAGKSKTPSAKLRVLFAGSLGQRKGICYFLRALDLLNDDSIEVSFVGRRVVDDCVPLNRAVTKHRWLPTVSHDVMLREMREHDVVVFPSLFEGFGLVITEAMSQGTPVITTPHTAGPDLIEDGVDGFLVSVRDSEAIAEKLEFLVRNRAAARAMQEAARRKAAARPWDLYRQDVIALAREVLNESNP